MPRRPNKTDYGMFDAPADIEAFYRTQQNEEVDEFLEKFEKLRKSYHPFSRLICDVLSLFGTDLFRIYEQGWNDGHANGVDQGQEQVRFFQNRNKEKT